MKYHIKTTLMGPELISVMTLLGGGVEEVSSGVEHIQRKVLTANDENAFLLLAYADILSDMGAYSTEKSNFITRVYTWMSHDHYIIQAFRVQTRWIYSFVFEEGKAYYITYDCTNNSIVIKKEFTLT